MLDFIKEQLQERGLIQEQETPTFDDTEDQMNDAILEYAHLFQELDDLSMNGTEANSSRPFTKIDIPLEDDVEIDSIELNMLDGRVMGVPMDATVQEQMQHMMMKTYDDFYQEAYESMTRYQRETDQQFADRVSIEADRDFHNYRNYIIQEGLFGFDKIPASSPDVPWKFTGYFGKDPSRGNDYVVRLPIAYQVDKQDRITKKQLTSIHMAQERSDFICKGFRDLLYKEYQSRFNLKNEDDLWNYATPIKVLVPVDPADKYHVLFAFELDDTSELDYWGWSLPVKSKGVSESKPDLAKAKGFTDKTVASMQFADKKGIRVESAVIEKPRYSRFIQEAIDFGNPDEAPSAAGDDGSGVSFEPAPDMNSSDSSMASSENMDAGNTENKEIVDTNDVSDEIAEKVSDETQEKAASNDINIDDIDTPDDTSTDMDMGPSDEEIDADLNDGADTTASLDDSSSDDAAATSGIDIDNMTIDELLAQGTEKLKGMTLQQLKDFMASDSGASDTPPEMSEEGDGDIQEAFFLTRGNIGKELDIHLRKALGILNDSNMEINQLCREFRKEGSKVNRRVHKASKMTNVFNETEIKQLQRLNQCTSDLLKTMRADLDTQGVATVKRLIQAFVQSATGVLKLIENDKNTKHIHEAFFDDVAQGIFFNEYATDAPTDLYNLMLRLRDTWTVESDVWHPYELDDYVNENTNDKFQTFMTDRLTGSIVLCSQIAESAQYEYPGIAETVMEFAHEFRPYIADLKNMLVCEYNRDVTNSELATLQDLKQFTTKVCDSISRMIGE